MKKLLVPVAAAACALGLAVAAPAHADDAAYLAALEEGGIIGNDAADHAQVLYDAASANLCG